MGQGSEMGFSASKKVEAQPEQTVCLSTASLDMPASPGQGVQLCLLPPCKYTSWHSATNSGHG